MITVCSPSAYPATLADSCGRVRGLILHLLDLMETSTQKLLLAEVDRQQMGEVEAKWRAAEEACAELERERDSLTKALPPAEKSEYLITAVPYCNVLYLTNSVVGAIHLITLALQYIPFIPFLSDLTYMLILNSQYNFFLVLHLGPEFLTILLVHFHCNKFPCRSGTVFQLIA